MSKDIGHTPVFPIRDMNDHPGPLGLTIRDHFAAQALLAAMAQDGMESDKKGFNYSAVASMAYRMADAMIEQRKL